MATITKQRVFNKAMINCFTEVILIDETCPSTLDIDDWKILTQGGYTACDVKYKTAKSFINRCLMLLTTQKKLEFQPEDQPAMDRRLRSYTFKSLPKPRKKAAEWLHTKVNGASDGVLRKLSAMELYIKRARKTVAKMMRLQWTQDLDVESLEARGHWASMKELLEVVSFHLPRYKQTVKTCQNDPGRVSPSDLTFATKFLATYSFIKVKGSRPMTFQYLTVEMVKEAKANGGFIDQKTFKTAGKYAFDSVILTETSMQILDGYIHFVRPFPKPQTLFWSPKTEVNTANWATR